MNRSIVINPITRLEGHGRIDIHLDDAGDVDAAYFVVPEFRGFERFCVGRPAEMMPTLTQKICGVCPMAHHMASTKALDEVFHVTPPPAARKVRELAYNAFMFEDHLLHFFVLGGPDFIVGPDAPKAQRNILGVVSKVGMETGRKVIDIRKRVRGMVATIVGSPLFPVFGLPGGISKPLAQDEVPGFREIARDAVEFARFSLRVFDDVVLANPAYVEAILGEAYTHKTYYMGQVNAENRLDFYDGTLRVVTPEGREHERFQGRDYLSHLGEQTLPWTYAKMLFLKSVGWKGFVDGPDSGIYRVAPLARLNAADGMATPLAQAEYEKFYSALGGKPVHQRLAIHWARLIELLYAAERWVELATDPEITSPDFHAIPTATPTEGIGIVEAPRGTLTHHYWTDERGVVTKVNLVVGTTNNNAPITMSIKKAASSLIKKGVVNEGLLNMVEMAFRAYDPCFGCATHSLPGQMPLEVTVHKADGEPVKVLRQFCE
jgi:F420-non-reducing hydrogenase large subunit